MTILCLIKADHQNTPADFKIRKMADIAVVVVVFLVLSVVYFYDRNANFLHCLTPQQVDNKETDCFNAAYDRIS